MSKDKQDAKAAARKVPQYAGANAAVPQGHSNAEASEAARRFLEERAKHDPLARAKRDGPGEYGDVNKQGFVSR